MKFFCFLVALLGVSLLGNAPAQEGTSSPIRQNAAPLTAEQPTPAQQRIATARRQIEADPNKFQAYNNLALALGQRARETANPAHYQEAEKALATGLHLAPQDFQLEKTQAALLLGRHKFAQAREKARALNLHSPDDVTTYGSIAEADIALGDYPDAEKSAQWMLNLLPNNVPGLLIASQLRSLYGDPEGALELLNRAYTETSPTEIEELAWIANQIASVEIDSGHLEAAGQVLDRAGQIFPAYPYTLDNLARVKLGLHSPSDAIALLHEEERIAPDAHVLYRLARAQELAGNSSEAAAAFSSFEAAAKAQINEPANANRELILYYAGSGNNAPEALRLAQHEMSLRHDVITLDAFAWALYKNGRYAEADVQMGKALAVGVRSAELFDHAGNIALKLNNQSAADRYFEASLQADPVSEYAPDARKMLGASAAAVVVPAMARPAADEADALVASGSLRAAANPPKEAPAAQEPVPAGSKIATEEFRPVPAALLTPRPTGTDRMIRTMQARVARSPREAAGYSGLGAAFFQRARETGDVEDYQLAEQSLTKSLDLISADLSATAPLATMAEVCMGEHRFTDALTYAQKALSLGSGDISPFAIVGDAYADTGEYEKAAAAYSRLTADGETAPPPRAAYVQESRVAYLRFVSGDTEGAIQLMQSAITSGIEAQLPSENLAWLYFERGEFLFQAGNPDAANDSYLAALSIHPGDYRALAGLGKVQANQGRYPEAILLYQKAIAVVPMPIYVAELGDLYAKSGNGAEAKKQYQLVEYIGLLGRINQVLHNRDLALFYADHDIKLTESLALAHKEFEVRHDVYTWDALAWALYKNGKYQDASEAMEHTLRLGTRDSLLLFHAGMIAARLGQNARAQQKLNLAIQINPRFHVIYADEAKRQLALLETQAGLTASGKEQHVRYTHAQ